METFFGVVLVLVFVLSTAVSSIKVVDHCEHGRYGWAFFWGWIVMQNTQVLEMAVKALWQ